MARSVINIKHSNPADLAKQLRSVAAKLDAGDVIPGADFRIGNARIQVAETQESEIRAYARANGIAVGTRGRFSKDLLDAYAAHLKNERTAKRLAAKARKADREAAKALVEA